MIWTRESEVTMFARFKSSVYNAIGGLEEDSVVNGIKQPSPAHTSR